MAEEEGETREGEEMGEEMDVEGEEGTGRMGMKRSTRQEIMMDETMKIGGEMRRRKKIRWWMIEL